MKSPEQTVSMEELLSHADWVRHLAQKLVAGAEIDDVVQDTWLSALRSPPGDDRNPRGWLGQVVKNVVRGRARSDSRLRRRQERAARPEALAAADEVVHHALLQRDLADRVLALDEPYRSVLLLRFFRDESPRAIAEQLHRPLATVRTQIQRGLELLRRELDERYGDRRAWCMAFGSFSTTASAVAPVALTVGLLAVVGVLAWVGLPARAGTEGRTASGVVLPERSASLPSTPELPGSVLSAGQEPALQRLSDVTPGRTPTPVAESSATSGSSREYLLRGRLVDFLGQPVEGLRLRWVDPGLLRWGNPERTLILGRETWLPLSTEEQARLRADAQELEEFVQRNFSRPVLARALLRGRAAPTFEARTDADGTFDLQVPAYGEAIELLGSVYGLVGRGPARGWRPEEVTTYFVDKSVDLRGRVFDQRGLAREGVRVTLPAFAPPSVSKQLELGFGLLGQRLEARSDDRGRFVISGVSLTSFAPDSGAPDLQVYHDEDRFVRRSLPADPEQELVLILPDPPERHPVVLHGRILRPDGSPARFARVYLGETGAAVEQDGSYSLEVQGVTGSEALRVASPGYGPLEHLLYGEGLVGKRGDQSVPALTLGERPACIVGRVWTGEGFPARGVEVSLIGPAPGGRAGPIEAQAGGRPLHVVTDEGGRFELTGLYPRPYRLMLEAGDRRKKTEPIDPDGLTVDLVFP